MTATVIYSIAVSSPRGLAAPAARDPPRFSGHRGGPRSGGRAWPCTGCTARRLLDPVRESLITELERALEAGVKAMILLQSSTTRL
jgi:hypothetical protein